jgi:uncharacterized protein
MKNISSAVQTEIVNHLVQEFVTEAIYLFGLHAWGRPNADSDLDFLVVISESQQTPFQRAVRAQRSLRGVLAPVDVLVKTSAEIERLTSVPVSLEAQILKKGKLLYGR